MTIPLVVDNREKKPYEFDEYNQVYEKRLNVGDYTLDGFEDIFSVERKTLDDLATSMGSERERFEDEIRRAQSLHEFAVVIEAPKDHVYPFAGTKNSPHYYSALYPNTIIGTVEKWPKKYSPLAFHWCEDRDGGKQKTLELLSNWFVLHKDKRNL